MTVDSICRPRQILGTSNAVNEMIGAYNQLNEKLLGENPALGYVKCLVDSTSFLSCPCYAMRLTMHPTPGPGLRR